MASPPPGDVTRLLDDLNHGNGEAADKLLEIVYHELRAMAAAKMKAEPAGHTLQPTALVHEAYMRLKAHDRVRWKSRSHFLGVAAQAMRRVLIDHARRHNADRRGPGRRVTMDDSHGGAITDPVGLIALDDALNALADENPRQAQTVELRYFGGLTGKEVAEVLDVSEVTVKRDWQYARAWLYRQIEGDAG